MVGVDQARAFMMGLPEVSEKLYHGLPSWRVSGKIFANLPDAGHMHLMLDEDDIRAAVASNPDACREKWWGEKLMALRVALSDVEVEELESLLTSAWRRRASKKLQNELDPS